MNSTAKPYFCRHCQNPLALSSDKVLSVGLVKISQPVKFRCGHCDRPQTWRPQVVKESIPTPVSAV